MSRPESPAAEAQPTDTHVDGETDEQCEDDVHITAKMLLTQYKGKALAKALKQGIRDPRVFSALMKNQAVSRRMSGVLASYLHDPDAIARLIQAGANVHFNEESLLVFAANAGHDATVEVLLNAGAVPTTKSLAVSVAKNHIEIVEQLLSAGATLTDQIWKKVVSNAAGSDDVDILQSLAPHASDAQVQAAVRDFLAKDKLEAIAALISTTTGPVASHAVESLCLVDTPASSSYVRLIRGLLQKGIKPDAAKYDRISENCDPVIIKLLARYMPK